MNFSASIPVDHADEANAALDALGFGPSNFSVPMMPDANGATHAAFHCWDNPAFRAAVESLPAAYGVTIRDTERDPKAQVTAMASGLGILWPPNPDWMETLPSVGDVRTFGGTDWRSTMEGNPFRPPHGWELVAVGGTLEWAVGAAYTQPTTVTGAAGTAGEGRAWTLSTASETAVAGREPWRAYMWAVWAEVP